MLDLSEHQALRTKLSSLRPCITQADLKWENQNHEQDITDIAEIEKVYQTCLEEACILISRPNQFPGYRSVVLFNSLFSLHPKNVILVTVSSDGRLNGHTFNSGNGKNKIPSSLADAMKLLETNSDKWMEMNNLYDYLFLFGRDSGIDSWFPKLEKNLETAKGSILSLLKSGPRTEVIKSLRKQVQHDSGQARLALCNALDRDALKIMRGTSLASIREGRWLTGGDGVSQEVILARKQAVRAYPLLAQLFSDYVDDRVDTILRSAIDSGRSLSDAIGVYFNLDKTGQQGRVKRLQGMTWQRAAVNPCYTMWRVHDILEMPDGTVPKTRREFGRLKVFKEFGNFVFDESLRQLMERLSGEGNPWNLVERMEQTGGRNVSDAVDFLARKLYVPALLNKIGRLADHHDITPPRRLTEDYTNKLHDIMLKVAKDSILQNFRTRELLDWSDRYHRNIARYEDRLVTIDLEQDWPGISGMLKFGNGHVARELTSSRALKIQGRAEDHCVGGYLRFVLEGENNRSKEAVLIFSIEKDNKIISTAEIGCTRQPCQSVDSETGKKTDTFRINARVVENLACSNKVPSRDAVRIAGQVARQLEQVTPEAWQVYLDGLEYSRAEQDRVSGIDVQIRNCGFDPFDRAMMEQVWKELKPALPRFLRKLELDGFIDQIPVNELILTETPGIVEIAVLEPD